MAAVLFALVIGLRAYLKWVGPFPGDRFAAARNGWHQPLAQSIANALGEVPVASVVLVTVVIGGWALWRRVGVPEAAGLIVAVAAVIWNALLKVWFGPTPVWAAVHHSGTNYPSGHVTYATAVFGYLAWIGVRHRAPELVAACALIIVGMGPARVITGAHLVSDAIGGYMLGAAWLIVTVTLVQSWKRRSAATGPPPAG